ncbi:MAG: fibronectin type III domain-containing protein, partial [Nitrosopumilaceae archaeon]
MFGYEKTIKTRENSVVFLLTVITLISISQIPFVSADEINYAGSVLATPWSGEAAAIGPDNNMCATSKAGEVGYWQNFGIKIPDKSKITGIEVVIDSSQSGSDNNLIVKVGKSSKILGTTEMQITPTRGNCASSTAQRVGGPEELWGLSWTVQEINEKTFGVQVKGGMDGSQVQLDSIGIIVHYASTTAAKKIVTVSTGPTNLVATPLSQSIINLSWSPPSDSSKIKNYIIEKKSPGDNDYVVIDNISPRFLTYSDAGLLGNTK